MSIGVRISEVVRHLGITKKKFRRIAKYLIWKPF